MASDDVIFSEPVFEEPSIVRDNERAEKVIAVLALVKNFPGKWQKISQSKGRNISGSLAAKINKGRYGTGFHAVARKHGEFSAVYVRYLEAQKVDVAAIRTLKQEARKTEPVTMNATQAPAGHNPNALKLCATCEHAGRRHHPESGCLAALRPGSDETCSCLAFTLEGEVRALEEV